MVNENMKKAREYAGLSQKAVSIDLNVSPPTVSDWEAGKINPSAANLKKLSALYGVSTDFLLGITVHSIEEELSTQSILKQIAGTLLYKSINEHGVEATISLLQRNPFSSNIKDDPLFETLACNYDQLNLEGREKLVDASDDLVQTGKYIKSDPSVLGREA